MAHTFTTPRIASLLLAGTALAALSHPVAAQQWEGDTDDQYTNPENWANNTAPTDSSNANVETTTNAPVIRAGQTGRARTLNIGETGTGALRIEGGGDLLLGDAANGGALNVGGSVTTNVTGGNGRVLVTGEGTTISSAGGLTLRIASAVNSTGVLEIMDGAVVTSNSGAIGIAQGSNGTLTVSGTGSRWDIVSGAAGIQIGNLNFLDARGTLNVLDGAVVSYPGGVGWTVGGGGTINVDGAGSTLNIPTALTLRGDINVSGGGSASFTQFDVGSATRANTITVSGPNSHLTTGDFFLARFNDFNSTVLVSNGGTLTTGRVLIGNNGNTATANVTVTGEGSLWRVTSNATALDIGAGASDVNISILDGARFESLSGFNPSFRPNTDVLISGPGSTMDIAANLSFGGAAAGSPIGTIVIENGASLITRGPSDNGIGFNGGLRTMEITGGSSWIMTGGTNSGLQIETTDLIVQDSTLSAEGIVSIGIRFSGTNLMLRNSDFTARALRVGSVAGNTVFIGTRADGSAGGAGLFNVGSVSLTNGNTLEINHTENDFTIASTITGAGAINHRAGTTRFTGGQAGYSGLLTVSGGSVIIDGALGGNGSRAIFEDARLGGSGFFGGDVTLASATLAPGNSAGTFTIGGDLVLGAASVLEFELGAPDQARGSGSDLLVIGGDLTLDGTLNIANLGGFGSGLYRLINYGGTLTDNGLEFGVVPDGFDATGLMLDLATSGQVNLLAEAPAENFDFIFWDGANTTADGLINGGSGTWSVDRTNWTTLDANDNGVFDPADFLIFRAPEQVQEAQAGAERAASPSSSTGTVTVDNTAGQVSLSNGVQFAADGYTVTGDSIQLDAPGVIFRVGDGTVQGSAFVATVSSPLIGDGGLTKTDLGTLILSGTNSYTGGTRVAGGTLQGNTQSLQGPILVDAAGTLVFDQVSDGTFAGVLSGTGDFEKDGAGVLTLSGNSSDFLGRADLLLGGLNITGTLGRDSGNSLLVTVAGTTLTGNGSVGNLVVGGVIAPGAGSAPGTATFNVDGDVTFSTGSLYRVDLAASGAADRIVAGGDAFINGGTVEINLLNPEVDYVDGTVFTILEAEGSLTGQFAGLVENSAFLDFTLGYDTSSAFLTLDLVRMFPDVALTFNQRQASLGLMELDRTAGSDSLEVYNALLLLDENAARDAFDLSSGEIYGDILAAGNRIAMSRAISRQLGSAAIGREGWNAWISGTLANARVSGDGNGARFEQDTGQVELGLDYHGAGNGWMIGVSGGWLSSDLTNDQRRSSADMDGWFASVAARYGTYGEGLTVSAAASYSDQSGDTLRTIAFGTINRSAAADVDTDSTGLVADVRFGFGNDSFAFGPVAGIEHASTSLDGYTEFGAGALSLSGNGASESWTRYGGGIFASHRSGGITALVDARYLSAEDGKEAVQHQLAGSPRTFTVLPARGDSDAVRLTVTLEGELGKNVQFGLGAHAYLAGEETSLAGTASLRIAF